MTHPNREEWMSFLYGELETVRHNELHTHLGVCAACRCSVQGWRATMTNLDQWQASVPHRATAPSLWPGLLRWGVAAVLLVGAGFGLGWLTQSAPMDGDRVRAEIVVPLRDQLRAEIKADILAALTRGATMNPFQEELRTVFTAWNRAQNAAQQEELGTAVTALMNSMSLSRREDREATLALLHRMRRDLETVAVVAQSQFQQTENRLGALVSYNNPTATEQ